MSMLKRSPSLASRSGVVRVPETLDHPQSGSFETETTYLASGYAGDKPGIVIVNSFGSGVDMLQHVAKSFASDGVRDRDYQRNRLVRTYDDPRVSIARRDALGYRALTLHSVVEAYDAPQTLVCWSTGGVVGIRYALAMARRGRADNINAVMLAGSAGLAGPDNPRSLAVRASHEWARAAMDVRALRMGRTALRIGQYIGDNLQLCVQELTELADTDISHEVLELRKHGIPVGVTLFKWDKIFPTQRVYKRLSEAGIGKKHVYEVNSSHIGMVSDSNVVADLHKAVLDLESVRS